MKTIRVIVPWPHGLHLRTAAALARMAQGFRSVIRLKSGGQIADIRNILSVIALCATMGMAIDLEINGPDEDDASQAIEDVFSIDDAGAPLL